MNIGSATSAAVATAVWAQTTRNLTQLQNLTAEIQATPTIGAGLILDLRAAAAKLRFFTIIVPDNTNWSFGIYNGTTLLAPQAGTDKNAQNGYGFPDNAFAVKNTSAGGIQIGYLGFELT